VPKSCFFISQIGEENSAARYKADRIYTIVAEVCERLEYDIVRADEIDKPGIITNQILSRLIEDDLIIADMTDHNPNVFYELAVRHATAKPVISVIEKGQKIPFDVAALRAIPYNLDSYEAGREFVRSLEGHIISAEKEATNERGFESPISDLVSLERLRTSDNPLEQSSGEILTNVQELKHMVAESLRVGNVKVVTSTRLSNSAHQTFKAFLGDFNDVRAQIEPNAPDTLREALSAARLNLTRFMRSVSEDKRITELYDEIRKPLDVVREEFAAKRLKAIDDEYPPEEDLPF